MYDNHNIDTCATLHRRWWCLAPSSVCLCRAGTARHISLYRSFSVTPRGLRLSGGPKNFRLVHAFWSFELSTPASIMNPKANEFVPSWLPTAPAQPTAPAVVPDKSWEDDAPAAPAAASEPADERVGDTTAGVAAVTLSPPDAAPAAPEGPRVSQKSSADDTDVSSGAADSAEAELAQKSEVLDDKKPVNVVLLGHVDAGKSTISGHILYLTGNVDERTMQKYEKEAKELNRESWKFAFCLDTSEQERAKGKTEECGQASFTTETRRFTILDAPGHKNYVPHMIGGASQADIGILVISARQGEFESGFERGGQTREHAMLAKTSGVRQMVIVVNKLDDPTVLGKNGEWSKERFDSIKSKLEPFLAKVGWNPKGLTWIPISGITGQNLKANVAEEICPWYKGESLLDTLEHLRPPERLLSGPVKIPISEKHKEMGTMVTGKLESGVIATNDKLVMMPNKVTVVVDAMMLQGTTAQAAEPGDVVRLRLKGIDEKDVHVGFVLCSPKHLVSYTDTFIANLMILEHKSIICAGYSAVMHIHSAVTEFTVKKLLAKLDRKTGKISERNPKFVRPGMKCVARLVTSEKICVEPYSVFPQLGRFMIRDEGKTIAVGTVMKLSEVTNAAEGDVRN